MNFFPKKLLRLKRQILMGRAPVGWSLLSGGEAANTGWWDQRHCREVGDRPQLGLPLPGQPEAWLPAAKAEQLEDSGGPEDMLSRAHTHPCSTLTVGLGHVLQAQSRQAPSVCSPEGAEIQAQGMVVQTPMGW